jgi:hypothetical protein
MTEARETTKRVDRYPEDPVANFLFVADLAPRLCPGCATYHMQYTARRAARQTSGAGEVDALDRPEMVALLAELVAERARARPEPVQLMLAGSADTALLSTAADAASAAGAVERVRFSVLDRCPTPLVLCAAFGRQFGLDVAIQTVDLLGSDRPAAADIIVLHSLFRFVPSERHRDLLNRLMSWLKPGGKLAFSMSLGSRSGAQSAAAMVSFKDVFRREVSSGRIPFAGSVDDFLAKLVPSTPRAGDLADAESLRTLFRDAKVRVEQWHDIHRPPKPDGRNSQRVLAVLSRPD